MEPGYLLSGRYRIADLIGRGSQSTVYRAYDELLQRDVAVKLFRNDADDLEQTRRQGEEIRILAGMSHHALVTLFDAGADLSDPERPAHLPRDGTRPRAGPAPPRRPGSALGGAHGPHRL